MGYQAADGIMMSWPGRKQSSPENLGVTHSTNGKDTQGVLVAASEKHQLFAFINYQFNGAGFHTATVWE